MRLKIYNFSSSRIIITVAIVFLLLFVVGCQKSNDMPPDREGPEPEPHNGVFISKNAIFTFYGNEKTVFVEFDEKYMVALNYPPNNTKYHYVFTWYDFGECRYDAATQLKLYHEESDTHLDFSLAGNTNDGKIEITYIVPGDEKLVFLKK